MDIELCEFLESLNERQLKWWFDSGSLLGLVRENKFIEDDQDIDIGFVYSEQKDVNSLINSEFLKSYKIFKQSFHKDIFKIKILRGKYRDIDCIFFKHYNGCYFSPQKLARNGPNALTKLLATPLRAIRHASNQIDFLKPDKIEYDDIFWKILYDIQFWKIPEKYFNNLIRHDHNGINIYFPNFYEDYLSFRYGDWKIPNKKWDWMDDPALCRDMKFSW